MVIATQYGSVYTLEISHTIPIGLDLALDVRCDPEIEMLTLKIMCNKKQPRIECHVDLQGWLPKGKNTCSKGVRMVLETPRSIFHLPW